MQNRTIMRILAATLCAVLLLAGCARSPEEPQTDDETTIIYDLDSGKDLTLPAEAGDAAGCSVTVGDTKLDKTEFTVDDENICISSYSLMFLELNQTYTVKVDNASGVREYAVKLISSSNVSLDEKDVTFDYAQPADLVKAADFGERTISELRLGAKDYADETLYVYDNEAKTLTLKKELMMKLTGTTAILVRLSDGKEFSFNVKSTVLARADFEDEEQVSLLTDTYGIFWGTSIETEKDGFGNTIGRVNPEYDHLFAFGNHNWGNIGTVAFDKGGTYQVEFDVKPADDSSVKTLTIYLRKAFDSYDPRCGIDPSGEGDDVQKEYTLDFSSGSCTGNGNFDDVSFTYDETTGFTHVTAKFKTSSAYDTIFNCNTGKYYFDGDRPGEVGLSSDPTNEENKAAHENASSIIWLFDNLIVTQHY